jgi:hypothetical protein
MRERCEALEGIIREVAASRRWDAALHKQARAILAPDTKERKV